MCSVRLPGLNLDTLMRKQTHCRCHSQKCAWGMGTVSGEGAGEMQQVRQCSIYNVVTPQRAKLHNAEFPLNAITWLAKTALATDFLNITKALVLCIDHVLLPEWYSVSFIEFVAIIPNLAPNISQHIAFKEREYIKFRVFMNQSFFPCYKYNTKCHFILSQVYLKHYKGN